MTSRIWLLVPVPALVSAVSLTTRAPRRDGRVQAVSCSMRDSVYTNRERGGDAGGLVEAAETRRLVLPARLQLGRFPETALAHASNSL